MKPMEGASVQLSIPTFVPGDWATNSEADATISANAKDAQRRRTRNNPLRQLQISMRNNGGFELTSRPLRHVIRWCFFAMQFRRCFKRLSPSLVALIAM